MPQAVGLFILRRIMNDKQKDSAAEEHLDYDRTKKDKYVLRGIAGKTG